tara:strand:+ start:317 stop:718 length:402 start_codon:yes stop_codon:yes gene_type:complete
MVKKMNSNNAEFYSSLHKKAQDIGRLSKAISAYLMNDLAPLSTNGSEDSNIYFSGDIVQQSISLSEEIIKAERTLVPDKKYMHARTLRWLTYRLMQNCKRLEQCNSNGKNFIQILRIELKKFKRLHKHWMLTL